MSLGSRQAVLEELRARERLLRLINITTKDILDPKGPDDRDYYLVSHLINIFTADYAHLIHWDPSQERAILVTTTLPQGRPIAHVVLNSSESKLTSSVLQSGHALALDDASSSKHAVNPASIQKLASPLQSALCIPLIARDYKLGMAIVAFNAPRHFTAEEVEYAELAGNQISGALRSAQHEL